MSAALERLLATDYLDGLEARPLPELRGIRAECQEVETGLALDPSSIDDDRLNGLAQSLQALEADVSGRRRSVFERLDAVQQELARRYRSGDASVDSLLS